MLFDWHKISPDPTVPAVKDALKKHLLSLDAGTAADRNILIDDFVRGRTVLDVGVVDHTLNSSDAPGWLHRRVRNLARECLGVDVLEAEVAQLRDRGYSVRCADATSDIDLGERFERVVLGEIIEHVDNPVALLKFARRHLQEGGEVFASTPNGLYIAYMVEMFKYNTILPNAEHVSFIPPAAALELGRRAGLELYKVRRISVDPRSLRSLGMIASRILMLRRADTEFLSHTYCYYYR